MEIITVYTKPGCPQCRATVRALQRAGLPHRVIDVTEDTDARDYVLSLGYVAAPVVQAGAEHWSGYRPDRIAGLTAATA